MTEGDVDIESTEALFEALRSPDLPLRVSVLHAVAESPDLALAFGRHQDRDVVDELIHQAYQRHGFAYWHLVVTTLAAFRDPRVVEYFKKLLVTWDRIDVLRLVSARLSEEPLEDLEPMLRTILRTDLCEARVSAVADILIHSASLTPEEGVRVSIANTQDADIAGPCDASSVDAWVTELTGPFGENARVLLVARGESAVEALCTRWERLTDADRIWLVNWGASHPLAAVGTLRQALFDPSRAVVLAALAAVSRMEGGREMFRSLVSPHVHSDDPEVRLAAIRAGALGLDWETELEAAEDPELIVAIADRMAEELGPNAVPRLTPLLRHSSWLVRAGAAQALIRIGPSSIPAVREMIEGASNETRVAVTSVLFHLGDVEWLEEQLLG